jgi:molybdate transport system substrate-binding protein
MGLSMKRREWLRLALASPLCRYGGRGRRLVAWAIFAAASLKNALDEIATGWAKDTGKPIPKISYAASSALAKQIEQARRPTCSSRPTSTGWTMSPRRT